MHHNESTCLSIFSGEPIAPGCLPDSGLHTYQPPFESLHSLPFQGNIIKGPRATDQQTQPIQHEAMYQNEYMWLPVFFGEPITLHCLPDSGHHTYQTSFESVHSSPFPGNIINGPRATDQQTQPIQLKAMHHNESTGFPVFFGEPDTPGCLPHSGYRTYKPPLESQHSSTFPRNIMNGPRATDQQTQPIQQEVMYHNEYTWFPVFPGQPNTPGCLPSSGNHTYKPQLESLHRSTFPGNIINRPRATDQQTQLIQLEAMHHNESTGIPVFSRKPNTPVCLPDSGPYTYKPPLESPHSSTVPGNIINGPRVTDQQTQPIQVVAMHHNKSTRPPVFSIEPNTLGCLPVSAHHTYQQPFESPHGSPFSGNIMNGLRGAGPISGKNTVISDNYHHEVGKKEHLCPSCPKVFPTPTAQNLHICTHTGEKPYECDRGKKAFSQSHHLKRHLPTHTGEKFSKCKRKTGEKKHSCSFCDKFLKSSYGLKIHIHTHTGEKPHKCDCCSRTFSQRPNLIRHLRTHTGKKPYECDRCKKAFSQSHHLKHHRAMHTGEKFSKCKRKTGGKKHSCLFCDKFLQSSYGLKIHIRTHTGEKPFKCDYCNSAFSVKQYLERHIRTHTGIKPYECDHCSRAFSNRPNLKVHLRTHTGEKPYKCDYCSRAFSNKANLIRHFRRHTSEKPYKCDHCEKAFSRLHDLNDHLRTHTGEIPYKCDHCSETFSQQRYLNIHLFTHTGEKPFKCDYCSRAFPLKASLIRHLRTHTGEKPYMCDHCKRPFSHSNNLKEHIRTHTNKRL